MAFVVTHCKATLSQTMFATLLAVLLASPASSSTCSRKYTSAQPNAATIAVYPAVNYGAIPPAQSKSILAVNNSNQNQVSNNQATGNQVNINQDISNQVNNNNQENNNQNQNEQTQQIAAINAAANSVNLAIPKNIDLRQFIPQLLSSGIDICLQAHNVARQFFQYNPLQWDSSLASQATQYAAVLSQSGQFKHSGASNQGENLYKGSASGGMAVLLWFNERPLYHGESIGTLNLNLGSGDFEGYGHFTQILWPTTTHVGCGVAGVVVVCRYTPPGNFVGQTLPRY